MGLLRPRSRPSVRSRAGLSCIVRDQSCDQPTQEKTTIMTTQSTIPTTLIPCPDWCEMPDGHGFTESDPVAGVEIRHHE